MLYAGAGNKLVQRYIELATGGKLRIFLESNTLGEAGEPQSTISLQQCLLADYPENATVGFSLCRTSDGYTASRLGQFIFVCFSVEDKRKWMWAIQQEIFREEGENALSATTTTTTGSNATAATDNNSTGNNSVAAVEAKRSSLNKFRFNTENYVIDRGCRPPLLRGFYLKRTGNFLQEYGVRWMELRDRVSNDNPTTLGGIVYAAFPAAPPADWSFVPMRVDTKVSTSPEKFRICVTGPNQDTVFFKFDTEEAMEEWFQTCDMLIERAKIENDPQFAMAMKLNDRREGSQGRKDDEAASMNLLSVGGDNNNNNNNHLAETLAIGKLKKEMMEMNWGSNNNNNNDDDLDDEEDNGNNSRLHDYDRREDQLDSEDEYEIEDLESDVPKRVHFITVLYSLKDAPLTVSADRDSEKVIPELARIISSPISDFRPDDYSPYKPQGKTAQKYFEKEKDLENKSFATSNQNINNNTTTSTVLVSHKGANITSTTTQFTTSGTTTSAASNNMNRPFGNLTSANSQQQIIEDNKKKDSEFEQEFQTNEKFFRPENASVEDVLERFERHTLMAMEVLGPSLVLVRLRKELDDDASSLKHAALHILRNFPRELKAAYLAQRIDNSLGDYNSVRESVLVRIDMAKFREEFRLVGGAVVMSNGGMSSNMITAAAASPILGNPASLTAAFAKKKEINLTVDEALRAIDRVTTESAIIQNNGSLRMSNGPVVILSGATTTTKASETNAKIRDAIQFLQHFLSQFRESFDVFDDAGYMVEEVSSAIERGTNFLQEL
jgi:hypothetical protein